MHAIRHLRWALQMSLRLSRYCAFTSSVFISGMIAAGSWPSVLNFHFTILTCPDICTLVRGFICVGHSGKFCLVLICTPKKSGAVCVFLRRFCVHMQRQIFFEFCALFRIKWSLGVVRYDIAMYTVGHKNVALYFCFIIIIIILFDSGSMAHKTQECIHKTQKR